MAFKEIDNQQAKVPAYVIDPTFRGLAERQIARFFARVESAVNFAEEKNGNVKKGISSRKCKTALFNVLDERGELLQ